MVHRIVDLLNLHFNQQLTEHDVVLEDPFVPNEPRVARNTGCWVLPTRDAVPVAPGVFYYDRLNLPATFAGMTPIVKAYKGENVSTGQLAVRLAQRYGIELKATDVVDVVVPVETVPQTVDLHVTGNNLVWTGSLKIVLDESVPALDSIYYPKFHEINPTGVDITRKPASVYSWDFDLSDTGLEAILPLLRPAQSVVESFADDLTRISNDPWCFSDQPGPFNLFGSIILHNGKALSSDARRHLGGNPNHQSVLAILLSHFCTNLGGVLLLGYRNSNSF